MTALTIHVIGVPVPQGSKGARVVKGRAQLFDTNAAALHPWRASVHTAAQYAAEVFNWTPPTGPIRVDITYFFPRPKHHFGTGRNAQVLKTSAPVLHSVKPDKDKLDRAVHDALTTAGVIEDDARIADGHSTKRYADAATGARITITTLSTTPAPSPVTPPPVAVAGEGHPTPEGLL